MEKNITKSLYDHYTVPWNQLYINDPARTITIETHPTGNTTHSIFDILQDQVNKISLLIKEQENTINSLKLDIAFLKNKITEEEKNNILKMLSSEDEASIELAKTIINELSI